MPVRNDTETRMMAGPGGYVACEAGDPSAALSAPSIVLMKPAFDSMQEESCSTCDTIASMPRQMSTMSVMEVVTAMKRQMSTLPAMGVMTAYKYAGSHDSSSGSDSPRSQLDDATTLADASYSGDGFDPRWLAETSCEERCAASLSGDGTLVNVGRNISGTHQCTMCSQQFGCETALKMHKKFTHEEVEEGEWLSFPSA